MSLSSDDAVVVLDTNVISEPLRPDPDQLVIDFMRTVSARSFITTVTLSEFYFGAWRLDEGKRRARLLQNISSVQDSFRNRTLTLTADASIAAICVTHAATLITRTTKAFDAYPGLRVINPWTPLDSERATRPE